MSLFLGCWLLVSLERLNKVGDGTYHLVHMYDSFVPCSMHAAVAAEAEVGPTTTMLRIVL